MPPQDSAMTVVAAGLCGRKVITQNTEHRGNRGMPVTTSVKKQLSDLAAPRANGENAEIVVTTVRPPGGINQTSPPQITLQTKGLLSYGAIGLIMGGR